jgi:hypothetical protein
MSPRFDRTPTYARRHGYQTHFLAYWRPFVRPELRWHDVVMVSKYPGEACFFGFINFFKGVLGVSKGQ